MSVELVNERRTMGSGAGRRKGMRRAWLALPVAAVLLMTGCGGDDDKDDEAKTTPSASAPAAPQDTPAAPAATTPAASAPATTPAASAPASALTGEEKKVADSWDKLFDNTASLDERKAKLENGDKMSSLVETLIADPMAKAISSKTTAVKIQGDKATVTYDIVAAGVPLMPNQTGQAVKQNGEWKVSLGTICSLVGMLKPGTVVEGCPKA